MTSKLELQRELYFAIHKSYFKNRNKAIYNRRPSSKHRILLMFFRYEVVCKKQKLCWSKNHSSKKHVSERTCVVCREKSYRANFTLKVQSFVTCRIRATTEEMEAMNKKLDMVLNKLENIESRLELFEKNLAKNTKKIKAIDNRCDETEKLTQNTVTLTKFEALEERIEQLEAALKSKNNQINNVSDNIKTLNRNIV